LQTDAARFLFPEGERIAPFFPRNSFCVILAPMGNKDKGRKETKKAPKPKPKPEPARRNDTLYTPAPPK
jgi:hypothetical protein